MKTYEIVKNNYINELGEPDKDRFQVRWRMKSWFFGIPYWKYVTERICGMGDCYNSRLNFKTKKLAEHHVTEILCKGIETETVQKEIVSTINCGE